MNGGKKIAVLSASPKVNEEAVSEWLAGRAEEFLKADGLEFRHINVRRSLAQNQTAGDYAYMSDADAMLIIFPLYIFCLPGILIRYLQDYYEFSRARPDGGKSAAVYAVVNCGFPEPDINREAVRVIRSFSEKIGADFRFGVLIGSGGMLLGAQGAPFMKKAMARLDGALAAMKDELLSGRRDAVEDIEIPVNFPRRLYFFAGNRGWLSTAKKNGLKKNDLYAKPYIR
jgi:hypothetical protein